MSKQTKSIKSPTQDKHLAEMGSESSYTNLKKYNRGMKGDVNINGYKIETRSSRKLIRKGKGQKKKSMTSRVKKTPKKPSLLSHIIKKQNPNNSVCLLLDGKPRLCFHVIFCMKYFPFQQFLLKMLSALFLLLF